jgi:1-acyl-sn-glycerol-3-phosphate acyltransferase
MNVDTQFSLIKLGEIHPQRGNRFSKWFGRMLLRKCHWHTEGEICDAPKFICVMAPHTSWWDFTTNRGVLMATGLRASWFIANKYARGPLGRWLAFLGAIPIDRTSRNDVVTQMAEVFKSNERLILAIFPEGTRKPVATWKTGFWHIAKRANVPIQLVAVDYAKQATVFGPIINLTDDMERDVQQMRLYFRSVTAKRPENAVY